MCPMNGPRLLLLLSMLCRRPQEIQPRFWPIGKSKHQSDPLMICAQKVFICSTNTHLPILAVHIYCFAIKYLTKVQTKIYESSAHYRPTKWTLPWTHLSVMWGLNSQHRHDLWGSQILGGLLGQAAEQWTPILRFAMFKIKLKWACWTSTWLVWQVLVPFLNKTETHPCKPKLDVDKAIREKSNSAGRDRERLRKSVCQYWGPNRKKTIWRLPTMLPGDSWDSWHSSAQKPGKD